LNNSAYDSGNVLMTAYLLVNKIPAHPSALYNVQSAESGSMGLYDKIDRQQQMIVS
jgi:hypothetical protein